MRLQPLPFRDLWLNANRDERQRWADAAGTSYGYLQKIAGEYAKPSVALALRLQAVLPRLNIDAFELEVSGMRVSRTRGGQVTLQPA